MKIIPGRRFVNAWDGSHSHRGAPRLDVQMVTVQHAYGLGHKRFVRVSLFGRVLCLGYSVSK